MLEVKNIEGGYVQGNNILSGISFEIPEGKTLAVIGQNGSGKSTLGKAIINTLPFRKGEVWLNGYDISNLNVKDIINKGVGIFLQGGKVFPHLTIKENLLFAGRNLSNTNLWNRINELLDFFIIFKNKKNWNLQASYLSGGERNSLALMMVLINKPKLLILDEPSAGLSFSNIKQMYKTLNLIKQKEKISILLIEQNVKEAFNNSNKINILQYGKLINILNPNYINIYNDLKNCYFNL